LAIPAASIAPTAVIPNAAVPLQPAQSNQADPEPENSAGPVTIIGNTDVPLAPFIETGSWALWNLILSIAGALLAILMVIRILLTKKRQDEEEENQHKNSNHEAEEGDRKRSRTLLMLLVPVLAVAAIILFLLTQDTRLPMVMTDFWTVAHLIIFALGVLSYTFIYKNETGDDSDDEQAVNTPA